MARSKIVALEKLAGLTAGAKRQGKLVVHCHGVFDLLHIGHIRYFKQAREMGDMLIVTLTPDRYVDKGPARPAFNEDLRLEAVASLDCVDYVALNKWPTAEETLRLLCPNIYVKGSEFRNIASDMTGKIGLEEKVVREIGAELAFTDDIVFSSTHLINTYLSVFPDEVREYLRLFGKRHALKDVMDVMDRMRSLKVLVVGDTIIDEYVYCHAIGKSSKDPVLVMQYQSEDRFAGGVLAVASHIANFAGEVELLTVVGDKNGHRGFISKTLASNITLRFFVHRGAPTLVKRRYLESYSLNKLLEIYVMPEEVPPREVANEISEALREELPRFDLVVAADYGSGAVPQKAIETLCRKSRFLAVNTQANAGNRGFHTITRYPRADYACIAEHEIRLETRDQKGDLRPMMNALAPRLKNKLMVVTRGRRGCLVRRQNGGFIMVPAFANKIIDRVGAGDAFFSLTSMAAAQKADPELIGFLGNVAGAAAVETMGNSKFIDKLRIKKHATALLK